MFPLMPAYHDGTVPTTAASVLACKQVWDADPRVTGASAIAAASTYTKHSLRKTMVNVADRMTVSML
jgi:hypothetical protein